MSSYTGPNGNNSPYVALPLTPPQTPESSTCFSSTASYQEKGSAMVGSGKYNNSMPSPWSSIPELNLDSIEEEDKPRNVEIYEDSSKYLWRKGMSESEKDSREAWLSSGRGRKGLRIVIVTENFLPKVDGVTRTLSRLLEHLESEGHECILLGPKSDRLKYASHPLVGTLGIPLIIYPGLKLNFLRPKFLSTIKDFEPDIIHFVDPIWLGAQTILAMELGWAGNKWLNNQDQGDSNPQLGKGLGGAVVASYHTNLATYATLFGLSFLTPIIWAFQSSLYSKLLLTLCPSPSTKSMLESQSFSGVRLWPRGVDLSQFGPQKRDSQMRSYWGLKNVDAGDEQRVSKEEVILAANQTDYTMNKQGMMTPPLTPWTGPIDEIAINDEGISERAVLLYVGRISWEKNLQILLSAYSHLTRFLTPGTVLPKLVFVGDGPARLDLESKCEKESWDVVFMGHRQGEELAKCYASADVFCFPSFTETFGQVVLEALASGLPVIGLDAEGTRDLVTHDKTGLLLSLPASTCSDQFPTTGLTWAQVCKPDSPFFECLSSRYAELISKVVIDVKLRKQMSRRGSTEGIKGYTWWDAMEACVDGYRESIRISRTKRSIQVIPHSPSSLDEEQAILTPAPKQRRGLRLVSRVVSRRLAYKEPHRPVRNGRERIRWMIKNHDDPWFCISKLFQRTIGKYV
ncbi:uncharacterized protein L201_001409 [Kwoniella dendrophila CBS 6074]|uniref:Glycosyl transferase family 1 domain-containing protein n=1 Tax=Kwoniella dendrophila CBS 6074 TaxID=1295534 RepID=A0AAX4JNY6_9TREE